MLGETVRGVARVISVEGRRVSFAVAAYAGERELGRGTHRRVVIRLERLLQNLAGLPGALPRAEVIAGAVEIGGLPALRTLRVEVEDGMATVTLNRPGSLNAVNREMTADFERLVGWLAANAEQVRVVTVTGEGEAFCAGDDLKELEGLSLAEARELSLRQARVYLEFERLPQPLIAAVNGPALGAGCVLAISCDLRVASHAARFGMPEILLGWPPGYGVAQLMGLVGKARALELCLTGEPVSAARALEWGLVNEVVPGAMLRRRVRDSALGLLRLPAQAVRETKRLVHADEGSLPKVTHLADTEAYVRCLGLADAREGIRAFVEKRRPRFTGSVVVR